LLQKDLTFPQEELRHINIGTSDDERLLQIRASLPLPQQERYKNKFIEHSKNFAWSYDDMPGLDP